MGPGSAARPERLTNRYRKHRRKWPSQFGLRPFFRSHVSWRCPLLHLTREPSVVFVASIQKCGWSKFAILRRWSALEENQASFDLTGQRAT